MATTLTHKQIMDVFKLSPENKKALHDFFDRYALVVDQGSKASADTLEIKRSRKVVAIIGGSMALGYRLRVAEEKLEKNSTGGD